MDAPSVLDFPLSAQAQISSSMYDLFTREFIEHHLQLCRPFRRNDRGLYQLLRCIWATSCHKETDADNVWRRLEEMGFRPERMDRAKKNFHLAMDAVGGPHNFVQHVPVESLAVEMLGQAMEAAGDERRGTSHAPAPSASAGQGNTRKQGGNDKTTGGSTASGQPETGEETKSDSSAESLGSASDAELAYPSQNFDKTTTWDNVAQFLAGEGRHRQLTKDEILAMKDFRISPPLNTEEPYLLKKSACTYAIYHGATYSGWLMLKACHQWTTRFCAPLGDLLPSHAVYFATNRAFPLYWAFTHHSVGYPNGVLVPGEQMRAVVVETPLRPVKMAFVNLGEPQFTEFVRNNLDGRLPVLPQRPFPVVAGGFTEEEWESFHRFEGLRDRDFLQVAVAVPGMSHINRRPSVCHLVNVEIPDKSNTER